MIGKSVLVFNYPIRKSLSFSMWNKGSLLISIDGLSSMTNRSKNLSSSTKGAQLAFRSLSLPSNIVFRMNPAGSKQLESNVLETENISSRTLSIVFGWLGSKDHHIEKFRKFWFERGFDVLSVRVSALDILFPKSGVERNASLTYQFLVDQNLIYDKIIFHAFSAGGYQMGEFFNILEQNIVNDDRARKLLDNSRGIILDCHSYSTVCIESMAKVVSRDNFLYNLLLKKFLQAYTAITYPMTYSRWCRNERFVINNARSIPGLVLCCRNDVISPIDLNKKVYEIWKSRNNYSNFYCWHNGKHIQLYRENPEEYQRVVDEFMSKLNFKKTA